jgi:phosphoglycolate phosphatase-like HAD superfamily hydrolase
MKEDYIFFDFAGTLVKMRPATLLAKRFLLEKLSKRFKLGIITGGKRTETQNILNKLKIQDIISLKITADDSKLRKPDGRLFPKMKIFAYIGDTKKDESLAKNGKVPFFRVNKKYNINQIIKKIL